MPTSLASPDQTTGHTGRDWLLVVDDDGAIRELLSIALGSETVEVVTAGDGRLALLALNERATAPVLVLVDVLMPGMDGLTLTRKLMTRLPRSKLVVMSGHLTDASWWPADLREVTFIAKPFRMAELKALVAEARSSR